MAETDQALQEALYQRGKHFSPSLSSMIEKRWEGIQVNTQFGPVILRKEGIMKIARSMKTDLEQADLAEAAEQLFPGIVPFPRSYIPVPKELTVPDHPKQLATYQKVLTNQAIGIKKGLNKVEGRSTFDFQGVMLNLDAIRRTAANKFAEMKRAGLLREARIIFDQKHHKRPS